MGWIAAVYAGLRTFALAMLAGSAHAQTPGDADDQAWRQAEQIGTADAYQRYLEEYPVGRHVEDAFRSLVESEVEGEIGGGGATRGIDMY